MGFDFCGFEKCFSEKSANNEDNSGISNSEKQVRAHSDKDCPRYLDDLALTTDSLIKENTTHIFDKYKVLEDLGSGSYGKVKKVCLINNQKALRAMKIISKENIVEGKAKNLYDEIKILKKLEHPNIIKIFEYFQDNNNLYIISEYCDQGTLLKHILKLGSINETVVKYIMKQTLLAVSYLHENKVFHGDIKLENIMISKVNSISRNGSAHLNKDYSKYDKYIDELNSKLKNQDNDTDNKKEKNTPIKLLEDMGNYEIKLIDFGCSKFLKRKADNKLKGMVGTNLYCSPEIINNKYNEKSDEWACGVLMYILISGEPPFPGVKDEEIFENVKKGELDFDKDKFEDFKKIYNFDEIAE